MSLRPIVLSLQSPSELLNQIIHHRRHPTTLLVGSSKQEFLQALIQDVRQRQDSAANSTQHHQGHPLLQATLMQIAVSRHIRTVFTPTVTHLRAFLSTFTTSESPVSRPPNWKPPPPNNPPLLLVYGLLELHRDASEWSAQGISNSLAALVEAAAGSGLRAAIVEPWKGAARVEDQEALGDYLAEHIPILNGALIKDDGNWSGRTVEIRRVLGRWAEFDDAPDKGYDPP